MKTRVLFKPDNELLALSIKSFLESEGIYAIVRSYQIPAYDSIAQMMRPNWGEIIVSEEDYQRAKELLDVFLKTTKSESRAVEPDPNHNDKPDDDANV
ncbi:MAG: DUF2007 domain-containing protein [candidate division WOR-3 bacterium]|nr:DUF2007 domain-containing protein [candidate division WOR-3 bacterium]MDH5682983.1 DUF2007 domain-containing protein [candidate division WOR-3 bacterium]